MAHCSHPIVLTLAMEKTAKSITLLCFILSILIVAFLVLRQNAEPPQNGFSRKFHFEALKPAGYFDLGYNSFYIAGIDHENIYLGNEAATMLLLRINYTLDDTAKLRLHIPEDIRLLWRAATVRVDSDNIYMMEGTAPQILHTKIPSLRMRALEVDSTFFSFAIPLSGHSFVLQVFDNRKQQYVLTLKRSGIPYDTYGPGILEKQNDGRFSVDGKLVYDPGSGKMVFLYFYRNQFITLDTSLNIIYKGNTLDTIRTANLKVAELDDGTRKEFMLAAPAVAGNKNICINSHYIFIHSSLKADNEDEREFKKNTVLDVYSLSTGQYQQSFYVENFRGNRIKSMIMKNDTLITISGRHICLYPLNINHDPNQEADLAPEQKEQAPG